MSKTEIERRTAHARSQAVYRASAKGKAKDKAWEQSKAGGQSKRLRNQKQRDKRRDALNHALAEEQQRVRDVERKLAEAKEKWGEPYIDENGVTYFRKPKG